MKRNLLIDVLAEEIRTLAVRFGMQPILADDLAEAVIDRVRLKVGGTDAGYVSKVDRGRRNDAVRKDFRGDNAAEVAKKHNLSERQVRRIVGRELCHHG